MDQTFLAGLGNIYVDEILHAARLHPERQASGLSRRKAHEIFEYMHGILGEAIAAGGTTIQDFVTPDGVTGGYQRVRRVYGRAGEPCPACGAMIRRVVVAQRGTHLCPKCQRRR